MEEIDKEFTKVKNEESLNNIDDIVKTLKKYHEKCNEKHSQHYMLNNSIDQLQQNVENDTEYIMKALEFNSKLIEEKKEESLEKEEKVKKIVDLKNE